MVVVIKAKQQSDEEIILGVIYKYNPEYSDKCIFQGSYVFDTNYSCYVFEGKDIYYANKLLWECKLQQHEKFHMDKIQLISM